MSMETFTQISVMIPKLLKFLEANLPKSAMFYNVTKAYLDKRTLNYSQTKFYSYNDDFDEKIADSNFCFAVIVKSRKNYNSEVIVLLAPDNPTQDMVTAFENSVNWTSRLCFAAVDSCYSDFIKEMCSRKGKLVITNPCFALSMPISEAASLTISSPSESVLVKELSIEGAEKVTARWQFSEEGTLESMKNVISTMCSSGVYVNSELVSWIVLSSYGSMVALYTEDDHRRKGYAELTMKYGMRIAAERGFVPNVQILLDNYASKNLMEKCGLEFSHNIEFVIYNPSS